jgi:hypothetical protein
LRSVTRVQLTSYVQAIEKEVKIHENNLGDAAPKLLSELQYIAPGLLDGEEILKASKNCLDIINSCEKPSGLIKHFECLDLSLRKKNNSGGI